MSTELIGCVFCGGQPKVQPIRVHYQTPRKLGVHDVFRVECECGAIGKCRPTAQDAAAAWNEPWQAVPHTRE